MKILFVLVSVGVFLGNAAIIRNKREAYNLPSGVQLLVGQVNPSFTCSEDGYYADMDHLCKIFHVCNTVQYADGTQEIQHFSFLCGNQTVFNQLTFTCSHSEDSELCKHSPDFHYLNQMIGRPELPFLIEDDVLRAQLLS
ncbi:U-scoloptoxin(01)-Cw1a-like [Tachypleus tridentatus]|uniref:U-scoloptoxin(01)-Cw1a-like n=1 Tax=Tachypleus tridentatus TaxID=6853 RepID=UPI003FD0F370